MKKVIITSFAVILAVALCIPIYAALSSKIEASMTDYETGYEEETGEPFGRAPAYVMIRCGKNQIYPESYFKGSVTYQEEGDPVTEAGTGADGVDYAVSIAYNRGDTLSVYYENYGNVIYVSYRQQGREDHNYSDESFINSFLETAENGVYRFIVTVALTDGNKIEMWEYPFDVEVCKEELVVSETDGVIYTDYGSYCVVSGHTESVPENVVIRSFVDFDGRQLPVRAIGENAFSECADIKSVTLPDGLIEIGKQAFWRCSGLQSINLPQGLKKIKNFAFGTCGSLASVALPDSLETLDVGAFALCGSLTSIVIPDKVTSLSEAVFANCTGLKNVTIGSGVRSIHYRAFEKSDGIESIIISDNNPKYHASGNCIIETNSKKLIFGTDDCVIPDDGSVTTIASRAFDYRLNLECISIPASVTKLEDRAFYGCPRLTTVYYGGTVSQWESATKTVYLENQYVLKYQCTVICSDGTVEPVVDSCIEYGTEPWDDETEPDQPQQFEKGDCNGDGEVNNKDVVALFRYVSGNNKVSDEYVYDYDNDGFANNKDVVDLFRVLSGGKDTETSAETEEQETDADTSETAYFPYDIYLPQNVNRTFEKNDKVTPPYNGENLLKYTVIHRKNVPDIKMELFGYERNMHFSQTEVHYAYGVTIDRYYSDSSTESVDINRKTGKIVEYRCSSRSSDFYDSPVNAHSSREEFIQYARDLLLEYTGVSTEGCEAIVSTHAIGTTYKYTKEELNTDFVNFTEYDPDFSARYEIRFQKKIGEVNRADRMIVEVNNDGTVQHIYGLDMHDEYEPFADVEIDVDSIIRYVEDRIDDVKKKYDITPGYITLMAVPLDGNYWVLVEQGYSITSAYDGRTTGGSVQYLVLIKGDFENPDYLMGDYNMYVDHEYDYTPDPEETGWE